MKKELREQGPVLLLNSPILTGWGQYSFSPLKVEEAKEIMKGCGFVSAIGHEATALFLSRLLGVEIPMNRIRVEMHGEAYLHAIVLRLLDRLPEGKILTAEEMAGVAYDLGYLTWEGV